MNKCDKCSLLEKDFIGYKEGYGSKYSPNVIAELNKFRQEIINRIESCNHNDCYAKKLLVLMDSDEDIKKKKGMN